MWFCLQSLFGFGGSFLCFTTWSYFLCRYNYVKRFHWHQWEYWLLESVSLFLIMDKDSLVFVVNTNPYSNKENELLLLYLVNTYPYSNKEKVLILLFVFNPNPYSDKKKKSDYREKLLTVHVLHSCKINLSQTKNVLIVFLI